MIESKFSDLIIENERFDVYFIGFLKYFSVLFYAYFQKEHKKIASKRGY